MKRLLTLTLVMVLSLSTTLLFPLNYAMSEESDFVIINEDFSVRNGVSFGITGTKIEAIELSLDSTLMNSRENWKMFLGSVAGYSPCLINYYFTDEKMTDLYSFQYKIPRFEKPYSEVKLIYNELVETMKAKYGEPQLSNTESIPLLASVAYDAYISSGNYYLKDNVQWIVKYNNEYIIIDAFIAQMSDKIVGSKHGCCCVIGYRKTSLQEIAEVLKQNEDAQTQKENAMKNDL